MDLVDNALIQHEPDLLGERIQSVLADLLLRQWRAAVLEDGRHLGVDDRLAARPVVDRRLPGRHELRHVLGDAEPVGERLVHRLGHVQSDSRTDQRQQVERCHGQPQWLESPVSNLDRGARIDRADDLAEEPREQAVYDEGRGILDQHAGLLELLADRERRGQRDIIGLFGPCDLQKGQQGHGVEEV